MTARLTGLLESIEVLAPQAYGGLQVFGLKWASAGGPQYVTLDEALAEGTLEVTEVSEGGSVPQLKLTNRSDRMVFLLAGEQLIGAKQNRVLNADIMAAPQSTLPIPVSCVEAGRWRYRSAKFDSSGSMSHSNLRKLMSQQAHASYRSVGEPVSDQGEVWQEVDRKMSKMKSHSSSRELQQVYTDQESNLQRFTEEMRVPEGCQGVVFACRGQIAGADLFDRPATLSKLWPKLLHSHALDALEEPSVARPVTVEHVRDWLHSGAKSKSEPFKSPGLGTDVRLESQELVGAGLVVEDHLIHMELFAQEAKA